MMDKRTAIEKQMHELVNELMDLLIGGKIRRPDYTYIMGRLRTLKSYFENKQFGSETGITGQRNFKEFDNYNKL